MILTLLFALDCLVSLAQAAVGPAATLNVANQVIAPDGFQRSAVLVNGVYPSPLIIGNKGDTFNLDVVNSLTDATMLRSTSIHWHGILQHGSSWADGPVGVNQCPISPDHSFLYTFSVPDQAGTFWYHSHFGTQYCDGLRGPLVVYDPNDPYKHLYDVDDESTVITLGEWYHTPAPSAVGVPSADSTLINGKGRSVGGPLVDLEVLRVEHGKNYRFRLVSLSCDPNYIFSIDGHQLTVIEVDGVNTLPYTVDQIQIFTGQRYSFILNATQPVDNYWVRALPNNGLNGLARGFTNGINSAILRYAGATEADPTTSQPTDPTLLDESQLVPLEDPAAPGPPTLGEADVSINLALSFNRTNARFSINGASFEPPSIPILLQLLSGARNAQDILPAGSIYTLPPNKVIEVSIPAGVVGGPHPFHLHGHPFSVVRSAGADASYNYVNPVRRDVVSLGAAGSNVTIRFTTNNAGPWIMHCHIEWHLELGLAVVFAEDTPIAGAQNTPDSWKELCPIYKALPATATSVTIVPTVA